jgi:hypothetical protein
MERLTMILHDSVSTDEIDFVAYNNLWVVAEIIKGDENTPQEVIYQTDDDKNFIHYIIEQDGNYPYLIVEGESIESTVNAIHSSLPIHSREEIVRLIQTPIDHEEYCKGILYLGLMGRFQKYDSETSELFTQILQHENPEVRIGGIFAMSYTGWSEFRDLVQPLVENDPDANVRRTAIHFVEGLNLHAVAS